MCCDATPTTSTTWTEHNTSAWALEGQALLKLSCCLCVCAQITRLRPGRGYSFRARAQNGQGQGPWSQVLQGSTAADVPGVPSQPVCSKRTTSGVNVRWEAPEQENGAPVVSYRWAHQLMLLQTKCACLFSLFLSGTWSSCSTERHECSMVLLYK